MRFVASWWRALAQIVRTLVTTHVRAGVQPIGRAQLATTPPMPMPGRHIPASSPSSGLSEWIVSWIDNAVAFLMLERSLIVRNIGIASARGVLIPYHHFCEQLLLLTHIFGSFGR